MIEERKWLLAVTSFELTNSVLIITNKNNSISVTTPGHWSSKLGEKTIDELKNLIELGSQKDIELHVEQIRKKVINLMIDYSLSNLDTFKNERKT